MKLNQDVIFQLTEKELLLNIGKNDDGLLKPIVLKKIEKTINSLKWENICLEEVNNVTGFLAVNHPDEYNLYWNDLVKQIKEEVLPCISKRLDLLIAENIITESIKTSVLFDLINIIMTCSYGDYVQSDFYVNMLKIYLKGNLPYGWEGSYPNGNILVY